MVSDKIIFKAQKNAPSPKEVDYWIDTTSNPNGGEMKYYNGSKWAKVGEEEKEQPRTDPTRTIRATFRISEDEVGKELILIGSQLGGDPNAITKLCINGKEAKNDKFGKFTFDKAGEYLFEIEVRENIPVSYAFSDNKQLIQLEAHNFKFTQHVGALCRDCKSLVSVNLEGSDFEQLTYISEVFKGCSSLTDINLKNTKWNQTDVVQFYHVFENTGIEIFDFNEIFKNAKVPKKLRFSETFSYNEKLKQFIMNDLNFDFVEFDYSFKENSSLEKIIIKNCKFNEVKGYYSLYNSHNVTLLDLSGTEFLNGNQNYMFYNDRLISNGAKPVTLNITGTKFFNTIQAQRMFPRSVTTVDLSKTIFVNVNAVSLLQGSELKELTIGTVANGFVDSDSAFASTKLTNVTVKNISFNNDKTKSWFSTNTALTTVTLTNVTNADFTSWFYDCDLTSFHISNCSCINAERMFYSAEITKLDLTGCDFSNCKSMSGMFRSCTNLTEVHMKGLINPYVNADSMFDNISTTGTFYYDKNYDYSKIIEQLPEGWTAVAE